jgi:8-oxo-dGTP pyrophosphatase MutT (NUDIX family)
MNHPIYQRRKLTSQDLIEKLEKIINRRKTVKASKDGLFTPAAVMLILRQEKNDYSLLFIKRTESSSDVFSGHMAFPGGKMKEEDGNKLETAIRETFEETGIDLREAGRIIGELDDFNPNNPRGSHYIVTPFVAFLMKDTELRPNEEVAEIIWIPLSHLKDEKNLEIRIIEKQKIRVKDFVFYYQSYMIWGMTARVLYKFLSIAGYLFGIKTT